MVGNTNLPDLDRLVELVPSTRRFRIEETRREELQSAEAVWRELARLQVEDGWLMLHDRVLAFTAPTTIRPDEDAVALEGELRLRDGVEEPTSVHLRHLGESRWRLTWLSRVDDPEGYGTRRRFFAQGAPRLVYDVEWRLTPDLFGQPVLRPYRSRFSGFETPKGRISHD